MSKDQISKINFFRRVSEIGGILLGIGLALTFTFSSLIGLAISIVGSVVLLFEQKKFNKFKK